MKKPSEKEIDEQANRADSMVEKGTSKYRGMSYEQGVADTIRWMRDGLDKPLCDEDYAHLD